MPNEVRLDAGEDNSLGRPLARVLHAEGLAEPLPWGDRKPDLPDHKPNRVLGKVSIGDEIP